MSTALRAFTNVCVVLGASARRTEHVLSRCIERIGALHLAHRLVVLLIANARLCVCALPAVLEVEHALSHDAWEAAVGRVLDGVRDGSWSK
eukprot:6192129-Pleurochrysis_carterae.AAC.5